MELEIQYLHNPNLSFYYYKQKLFTHVIDQHFSLYRTNDNAHVIDGNTRSIYYLNF